MKHDVENEADWTEWIQPEMSSYTMVCCDCGLVHELQFQVFRTLRHLPDGSYAYEEMQSPRYRVKFRARRVPEETLTNRGKAEDFLVLNAVLELKEALEELMAVQNGPPLMRDAAAWEAAMRKAHKALHGDSKSDETEIEKR
jgi:hypothetical protein